MSEASILCVGSELTEGITQDTHFRFLSSHLTAMGFSVRQGVTIPDNVALYRSELAKLARQSDLVIITGGLGPTSDDLTREMVAEAAGVELEFHDEAWAAIQARFSGRTLATANRKQAMAPQGFSLIPNANGTAPGFYGQLGTALVVALPGPPSELRPMVASHVLGLLESRFGVAAAEVLWGTAFLVPESNLEEALAKCRRHDVTWGTRVEEDRIVFGLRGGTRESRESVMAALAADLGQSHIRRADVRAAEVLTQALLERGWMLATAESCTGGLLGKWITDLPGSSRVYWGGFVTYADQAKSGLLGVTAESLKVSGAVSREVVTAMADGALGRSAVQVAIAVSGVAGPDGGTPEKPVGTVWIAVATRTQGTEARRFLFPGARDAIRRRSAVASFLLAEAMIRGHSFEG